MRDGYGVFKFQTVGVGARHCSNDSAPVVRDVQHVARWPVGHAISWRLARWACSTLITVGIIYPHHAGVNTFFLFFLNFFWGKPENVDT